MEVFETGYRIKRTKMSEESAELGIKNEAVRTAKEVASFTGMVIPLSAGPSYIRDNLRDYQRVLSKGKDFKKISFLRFLDLSKFDDKHCLDYLKSLRDQEIFDLLGIKVGYRSREELVTNSLSAITKKTFFLPNVEGKHQTLGYGTVTDSVTYNLETTSQAFFMNFSAEELSALALLFETFIHDE